MIDLARPGLAVGVVGAGAMGAGIAEVLAVAGHSVRLTDARDGAAETARAAALGRLDRRVAAGRMPAGVRDAAADRLRAVEGIVDMGPCDLVIEAIVEDIAAKRALLAQLAGVVASDAVLASNTSSLPIGALAAGMPGPARFAGLHFFNPVPAMRLVEVIPGPDTAPDVVSGLQVLVRGLGKVPVLARDTPGFLVNFGGRAYPTEALAIVHEGAASPAQIDAVMRDCWGFRMGPFELMDLTGMDVNFPVTAFVHAASFGDPRLRSTPLHRYMLDVGHLGRKTGRGFFDHAEGAVRPSPDWSGDARPAESVVLPDRDPVLAALLAEAGAHILTQDNGSAPVLVALWGEDCSAYCARTGTDHRRLFALDPAGALAARVTLMAPPGSDAALRDRLAARLATVRKVTCIADCAGFIGQRIAAMVANLGCEMAQTGLATPADIDTAMELGLNYPVGPLALADRLGPPRLLAVLLGLHALTGDDRYRPSQWLRRRAQLGLSARKG